MAVVMWWCCEFSHVMMKTVKMGCCDNGGSVVVMVMDVTVVVCVCLFVCVCACVCV